MRYQHFWPPNDFYFGVGAATIIDEVSLTTNDRNYLFVNLNRYSLLNALNFFSRTKDINKIIIIISSSRLMPLAQFWLAECDNVIAAFDISTSVENIIKEICRRRDGEKIPKEKKDYHFKINRKDIVKMKYFLTECGMEELQDRFMNSPSTMYRWRKELAVKFGVREPRHLLLPESAAQQ
ncbi:Vi polysaccharide biosynthesis regulator TviA [Citrobacter amalonaticus]|uniref:Vi polysaccharide biosynthesis regulator TviA n=1 Tax=Citrobacter amalonaticus TaxID=35703 RepID=A0A2S4RVK1_CITAM|nr:Vi polysaccharide biosynthesis regulator TviA [Citrobacter amalonaticus]POT56336.1 Vi polysaccharide biosynthesis regulator TviA [Citrobacter amalonaticus]POT74861.1 Vi polysaccharide biosynthesis regulator TviA [Citrobacter amalonaticus]POU64390.1 Vi polysaccharide biosynthesis regulator TviA [Citrobacter amalonaticus]POV04226.1 Vi polysaccharide biosynthesis regulator TviA [Citrobacter amalonaticus]